MNGVFDQLQAILNRLDRDAKKMKKIMKDSVYPYGIDDLVLVDGVYQKRGDVFEDDPYLAPFMMRFDRTKTGYFDFDHTT